MTLLVADISNSRTKLALACGGELVSEVRVLPTAAVTAQALLHVCADWSYDVAVLCSVVPAAAAVAATFFASRAAVIHIRAAADLPVDFSAYAGRTTLGADRVANVVAAVRLFPAEPLVVIDAGTATTLDVVMPAERAGEKPHFLGGAIAPGVGTMARALHHGTAQLPPIPLVLPSHAVGKGTTEAIQNGCVRGYRGLLRELIAVMEQECECRLKPVLTGGDAPLLAELMPELGAPDLLLTLRGIALCAEKTEKC